MLDIMSYINNKAYFLKKYDLILCQVGTLLHRPKFRVQLVYPPHIYAWCLHAMICIIGTKQEVV